jgi:hypothetical protein
MNMINSNDDIYTLSVVYLSSLISSLSDQLYGDPKLHSLIRKEIIEQVGWYPLPVPVVLYAIQSVILLFNLFVSFFLCVDVTSSSLNHDFTKIMSLCLMMNI